MDKCPKCGAEAASEVTAWRQWACESIEWLGPAWDRDNNQLPCRGFEQSDRCRIAELEAENAVLRLRLLSAAGDDLCRLSQDEIKAYTTGKVQIPPKGEFIASCERFHAQIANDAGELSGCLTLAQLIAENAALQADLAWIETYLLEGGSWANVLIESGMLSACGDGYEPEEKAKYYTAKSLRAAIDAAKKGETKDGCCGCGGPLDERTGGCPVCMREDAQCTKP